MRHIKNIYKLIKPRIMLYIFLGVMIGINVMVSSITPVYIKNIVDVMKTGDAGNIGIFNIDLSILVNNFWIAALILMIISLCEALLKYLNNILTAHVAEGTIKDLRDRLFNHLQHLPQSFYSKNLTGDIIQRCTADIDAVRMLLSTQLIEMVIVLFSFIIVITIMMLIDVKYTVFVLVLLFPVFVYTYLFNKKIVSWYNTAEKIEGKMITVLSENVRGSKVVKAFGAFSNEIRKFLLKSDRMMKIWMSIVNKESNFISVLETFCVIQNFITILVGVYWVYLGNITLGTLIAFTSYSGSLSWRVKYFGRLMAHITESMVSFDRILYILEEPVESEEKDFLEPEIKGEIEFENVSFRYDRKSKPAVDNVSFKIKKGQTVAFIGTSGSGKSTISYLITRILDYSEGSIKIDGIELNRIKRKWVRKNVGLILQEAFMFSKTIYDNLKFGNVEADKEEVYSAAKTAAIHETINKFKDGYATVLGERGTNLSGGQRQRLSIARTIMRDCPILIFDDSLSAVDMETEIAIRRGLKKRCSKATTVMITHRVTTAMEADIIFVMDKGKIVQEGTHEELLSCEGLYRSLWNIKGQLEEELQSIS